MLETIWILRMNRAREHSVKVYVMKDRVYETSKWYDPGYWICKAKDGECETFKFEYDHGETAGMAGTAIELYLEEAQRYKNLVEVLVENNKIIRVGRAYRTDDGRFPVIIKTEDGKLVFDSNEWIGRTTHKIRKGTSNKNKVKFGPLDSFL